MYDFSYKIIKYPVTVASAVTGLVGVFFSLKAKVKYEKFYLLAYSR